MNTATTKIHEPCPFIHICSGVGYCHEWKREILSRIPGKDLELLILIRDCDKLEPKGSMKRGDI